MKRSPLLEMNHAAEESPANIFYLYFLEISDLNLPAGPARTPLCLAVQFDGQLLRRGL